MDNIGLLAYNLNEFNMPENLRDFRANNTRPEPAAPQKQQGQQQADVVDLSPQALQLSRLVENPPEERVNPATGAETAALEQEYQQPQAGIPERNANGIPVVNENVYPVNGNRQPGAKEEQFNVTPGPEAAPAPAPESSVPGTAEGMVARETETTLRPENSTEANNQVTTNPMGEANQAAQVNGIQANSANNSPVTDAARAAEPAQYQEQALLQAVGTQLAQAVPPSSIFSLLA